MALSNAKYKIGDEIVINYECADTTMAHTTMVRPISCIVIGLYRHFLLVRTPWGYNICIPNVDVNFHIDEMGVVA